MITLNNYSHSYGDKVVLQEINFTVHAGEQIALLGSSGAGKSTLVMALYEQLQQQAALCPQQLGLVDALSVYHNIFMGQLDKHNALYNLWNLFAPVRAQRVAVTRLGEELGIAHLLWKPAGQLSGGERQRVAVGRALYKKQPTFIGDEPVTGLDPTHSRLVLDKILNTHDTVIVALHDPQLALSAFDRIVGLYNGKIVFDRASVHATNEQLHHFYSNGMV